MNKKILCAALLGGIGENVGLCFACDSFLTLYAIPVVGLVDEVVSRHRRDTPDWVLAIGGGSAVDAGKAISAMLPQSGSVKDFLEGREVRKHDGRKLPFIAVPTSSGTGSEATKNAVLSEVGENGFKSSLRHDNFMPDIAVIDPELMRSCPPGVTAACGLDALTQLLESWVSSKASPITDALALSGLEHVAAGFLRACEDGENDLEARGHMAYAALLSGLTLAKSPEWTFNLGYQHSWDFANDGRLTVRVQTHYESSKNLDYHNFAVTDQDAYTKTDLMVTYDAPGGAWSLMAYGRNLEDEAVLVQAAPDAQNANRLGGSGAYAPPRLYGVQLTARF